jgi:hypothetical protein
MASFPAIEITYRETRKKGKKFKYLYDIWGKYGKQGKIQA